MVYHETCFYISSRTKTKTLLRLRNSDVFRMHLICDGVMSESLCSQLKNSSVLLKFSNFTQPSYCSSGHQTWECYVQSWLWSSSLYWFWTFETCCYIGSMEYWSPEMGKCYIYFSGFLTLKLNYESLTWQLKLG